MEGAGQLTGVGVAMWKAWPAVEKCLLKFSIIAYSSVVTVFPSPSAVGSWEEVFLFSVDFTGCKFLFEKASLFFPNCLCILVSNFPEKWHIAGAFDANVILHRIFLCWSRAVRSGVNQELHLFLVLHFLNGHAYLRW